MKDSTRKMSKELGFRQAEMTVHGYLYAKYMPDYLHSLGKPLGLPLEDVPPEYQAPPEVREMIEVLTHKVIREAVSPETSTYHGKVMPVGLAEDLVRVDEDIELRDLEAVIPYRYARDIVLRSPQTIAVVDCACRTLSRKPCEPLDVCLAVGDPFASFVLEHKVMNARRISADEAVSIIKAEHERGHVHGAFFKDVTGGRFYAICNCCACCCMGMLAYNRLGAPMLCSSGFVARVEEDCNGCGDCAEACPFDAVVVDGTAVVDEAKCMGCGVCEAPCPSGSIHLELDPEKPDPLDIKRLIAENRGKAAT